MTTLYDVFAAIRDDEADHVSAMKTCLDPETVSTLSPSLEKRALTAAAIAAAIGVLLNGGFADFDAAGNLVDAAADETVVDATMTGVAETLSRLGSDAEQGIVEESTGPAVVGVRALMNELSKIVSRLL